MALWLVVATGQIDETVALIREAGCEARIKPDAFYSQPVLDCSVMGGTNGAAMIAVGCNPEPMLRRLRECGLQAEAELFEFLFKGTIWLYYTYCSRTPTVVLDVSSRTIAGRVKRVAQLVRYCARRLLDNKLGPIPSFVLMTVQFVAQFEALMSSEEQHPDNKIAQGQCDQLEALVQRMKRIPVCNALLKSTSSNVEQVMKGLWFKWHCQDDAAVEELLDKHKDTQHNHTEHFRELDRQLTIRTMLHAIISTHRQHPAQCQVRLLDGRATFPDEGSSVSRLLPSHCICRRSFILRCLLCVHSNGG